MEKLPQAVVKHRGCSINRFLKCLSPRQDQVHIRSHI